MKATVFAKDINNSDTSFITSLENRKLKLEVCKEVTAEGAIRVDKDGSITYFPPTSIIKVVIED